MKIGMLHPRSGVLGMWTPAMDAAALVGAAEINAAGGILGEELELVFADCGFSDGEAMAAVDTLIEMEDVGAIIGGHSSNNRDAVSRRVASRVPYIYTAQYEGIAVGPSTVAIGSVDDELLAPSLQWMKDYKRADRYFFIGNDYIWPRMALRTTRRLVRQQGADLVGHALVATREFDYTGIVQRIAASGAQVVIEALVGMCAVEFNRAFAAAGLDRKMLRFGLIIDETVVCGIGPEATANLYTAANYFAGHQTRFNDHFLELYHDAFGVCAPPVSAANVGYYEGLHVLARLAQQAGTTDSQRLAHHLMRSRRDLGRRHLLDDQPSGQQPIVYLGEADGVTLQVVTALTH
jgi:urea transport system substrate-binding protein